MDVYKIDDIGELLKNNAYAGRGIVIGKTPDGKKAVTAYFIMGRSENSRNRIFKEEGENVTIYPFDESKVEDPSLIIYSPIKKIENKLIVTNGDQTDTIYDFIKKGECFREALKTRAVSYTHLDVYKRQVFNCSVSNIYITYIKRNFVVFIEICPDFIRKSINIVFNGHSFWFACECRQRIAVAYICMDKMSESVYGFIIIKITSASTSVLIKRLKYAH